MGCEQALSINQASSGGDLGMDQAIYFSNGPTQKIFGVRGQWLFQFNPVTGLLENSLRFATNVNGPSSIVGIGGNLYIGTTVGMSTDLTLSPPAAFYDADIYVVNAAAFTFSGRLLLANKNNRAADEAAIVGWRYLVTDGANIYGFNNGLNAPNFPMFSVNPLNIATFNSTAVGLTWVTDLFCDTVNGILWATNNIFPNLYAFNFTLTSSAFDTNGTLPVNGVCWNASQNKVIATKGDFQIAWANAGGINPGFANFAVNTVNSAQVNANPYRAKSVNFLTNARYGQVLIAGWADNTILVFNANSNTFSPALTGFNSPIDIVVTPTTNWAVQSGAVGLQQIP